MRFNFLPLLRLIIGLILLVSGLEKTISSYQNFLFVIQAYHFLPSAVQEFAAKFLPWAELITGLLLILGLYTEFAVRMAFSLFAIFIIVVAQALIRGLSLEECGCFGKLISLPPHIVIMMDLTIFICLAFMQKYIQKTSAFSIDQNFKK